MFHTFFFLNISDKWPDILALILLIRVPKTHKLHDFHVCIDSIRGRIRTQFF
jgi:hypothetical protein